MENSPLTHDPRPSFQPKIASLYESLFKDPEDDRQLTDGFWTEFFLLRCHPPALKALLDPLSADDLLHLQLFCRAVACVKAARSPCDEIALDTLTLFLQCVLSKRYTNFSSDVIAILTGLDAVDPVFTDFVASLDACIKAGRTIELRRKAVRLALCIACGAFQTGILSYFAHRDLFPALMKYINDPDAEQLAHEPFLLLGILANYNKFEFQNPYQARLSDFVNEATIKKMVASLGQACLDCRSDYVDILDDLPEGWTWNNMLSYVGLTMLTGNGPKRKPSTIPVGDASKSFSDLPSSKAGVLLTTYDFVAANKLFCHALVNSVDSPTDPKAEPPICAYLSFTSYLLHHASRSPRATLYGRLNLLVLRILLEDQGLCKRLIADETKRFVRLCRQRQPLLPLVRGKRPLLCAVLDLTADALNHNLRKKLDVELYVTSVGVLMRALSFLIRTRTRLPYHWAELWKSILGLTRFLAAYAGDLRPLAGMDALVDDLVNLVALALCAGDAFLPDAASYDDLFYKLVEAGDVLVKFRDAYGLAGRPSNSISTLISVSEHYYALISDTKSRSRSKNLSPQQVAEVIKQGYETLSIESKEGLDAWERYRESDERGFLKRCVRMVVAECRADEG